MPTLIQKVPEGLLASLSAVGTGRNPNVLPDELTPTFNARDFYLGRIETFGTSSAGHTDESTNDVMTVPNNQLWLVKAVSVRVLASAVGVVMQASVQFAPIGALPVAYLAFTPEKTAAAANNGVVASAICDFLAPSGSIFQSQLLSDTTGAGSATLQTRVLFHRIIAS